MTDFASLAMKIDSTEVERGVSELDKLTAAGARSEASATGVTRGFDRVTASAGAQRAGMQQLSYQIGDVAQQFALGVNPMTIFAQQGGQVVQAIGLMRGTAGGLIGFLSGPWGAVFMGAITILGSFGASLIASGKDAKNAANDWRDARSEAEKLVDALKRLNNLRKADSAADVNRARMQMNALTEEEFRLQNRLSGGRSNDPNSRYNSGNNLASRMGRAGDEARLTAIRQEKMELKSLIDLGEEDIARREKTDTAADRQAKSYSASSRAIRTHTVGMTAEQRAYENSDKAANAFIERLKIEQSEIGKTAAELRMMAAARAAEAAPNDAQKMQIMSLAMQTNYMHEQQDAAVAMGRTVKSAAADAASAVLDGLEAQTKAQAEYNATIADTVRLMQNIGGLAGAIGVFHAIATGNARSLTGPAGYAVNTIFGTPVKQREDGTFETLGDRIEAIFDKNGKFTKALGEVIGSAGQGAMMGAALFGTQNKGAQIGGAIGGTVGKIIGGPLGELAGSLFGSLIGGIFKKTKFGAASISNGVVTSSGNRADLKSGAGQAGSGIAGTIEQIAERLGGTVGNYAVSIGLTNGNWNVNPGSVSGKIGTKWQKDTIDFKKDQEGAIRWAIANAIQDGAIQGVREGVNTLLKAGTDIETQLSKALKFQGVFDDLKRATDPLGYNLEVIARDAASLNRIFAEAGASAEDYAKLEELLAIKRREAAEQARKDVIDKIREPYDLYTQMLELMGKGEEALAAQRLIEIATLKDSIQPLQAWIYQMQDARKVIDTFQPLADDLKAYRSELLGGGKDQSYGYLAAQFRATAIAAGNGDATGLGGLRGAASSFLDAAKENAASALDYQRAQAEVLRAVDKGIFAAETQVDYAQAQLDAINNSANILANMKAEMAAFQAQITENTGLTARLLKRFEGDGGLMVVTPQDEPLQVQVVT